VPHPQPGDIGRAIALGALRVIGLPEPWHALGDLAPYEDWENVPPLLSDAVSRTNDAPAIAVTMHDVRCSMINFDPDTASPAPEMLKAVVRANQNNAGIYGVVTRIGRVAVGQTLFFHAATA
jgi:hypothetical protein